MRAVDMTTFMDDVAPGEAQAAVEAGRKAGDCMRACVASVLALPLDAVPHFAQYRDEDEGSKLWFWALVGFFYAHGYDCQYDPDVVKPRGLSLMDGYSPRGHRHVCVAVDGEVAHDPHPSRDGMQEIVGYFLLSRLPAP